ncbi:phosphoenolpyruvate--protein phosphotransferase [Limosilactobacillus fastidiosus]|uniref:Phosphoenolpyruvate-protein phosphotransferase n=1 Tax=Limosilactobacillus fastidiosus TaxID=2759855 RepID=A0A7W3TYS4_9LACO|nr:phosphoenolpyruvate--protein phosphotransferase [Limosilactobacillus fastidiosus]MBB1085759.1 phosphoenolpyruvate--protein phosphotransferase [Limosilactobacillus fastidiosus]MCD7086201.1 phosphoenolpyruvate--protein phosphotransferase [Limosilactobacillus fastidiosus]MCD7114073.1 phosphoenolpyruvate--protein phosphotransferase [Limosilactobacillus fastidiosus]MCD7115931.1 phosphoenolpyruvate--protein phosphotransferase [Limosilactobacillus fastidiosus]
MTLKMTGTAASNGVGIAPVYIVDKPDLSFEKQRISDSSAEIERFKNALLAISDDLKELKEAATKKLSKDELAIFDVHIEILNDPEMFNQVITRIRSQRINAETAFEEVISRVIREFESMTGNKYMQERATDFASIRDQVLAKLEGKTLPNLRALDHPVIVVAHMIGPSDTSQMNAKFVKGIVTEVGGRTSHAAIMARSLQIPAIVGCKGIAHQVKNGERAIVDGFSGTTIIEPTTNQVKHFQQIASQYAAERLEWAKLVDSPSLTKDGQRLTISANIGSSNDIPAAVNNGADEIGLFRTEFLYMKSEHLPTEEEQLQAYKEAVESLGGRTLVVRTLDIGGDKPLTFMPLPHELNPFLGYRAIRISLDRPQMFRTQLRALIRASQFGRINIMFPMITTLEELQAAKKIYYEERKKLRQDYPKIGANIKLGIMIEVPLAALYAERLAKEVNFFSIGTNDLIQYCFAADRGNASVSYLYQPLNPPFLKLIAHIIKSGHQHNTTVAMCGEMAGDRLALPLLMGMGLDEYSMSATSILRTRSMMRGLNIKECQQLYQRAVTECETATQVHDLVEKWLIAH